MGSGSAAVNYTAPVASDNCAGVGTPNCSPASGASFPIGTNTVVCTATDASGNTNSCAFLVIVQQAFNPAFRVLSIQAQTTDVNIVWMTAGGRTNAVQATAGLPDGSYATNNFANLPGASSIIIVGSGDAVTNWVDSGGATNAPARYYRIRLVP